MTMLIRSMPDNQGYTHTHTHTHKTSGFVKARHCCVTRALPFLLVSEITDWTGIHPDETTVVDVV
jgi:hypothetical protein